MATKYRRDIPWLKVVQFHHEVTRRAEEAFFSLPADSSDSERWSSIRSFEPASMAGPWLVDKSDVVSAALRREFYAGDVDELYLGGPCFWQWRRGRGDNGKWYLDWRPVFYRQVRWEEDDDRIRIIPEAAAWEPSPLLINLLERMAAAPEGEWSGVVGEIIERAHSVSERDNLGMTQAIVAEIRRAIPEAAEAIEKPLPDRWRGDPPSDWVVFRPPTSTSPITFNLMRDFERLESRLEEDPEEHGGLALLEDPGLANPEGEEGAEPIPIVPLNESQRTAVKAIIGSRPMTVISGPPGCGKSQVVLSVLLNAWAEGRSVLFASNNNQAVDVVRDRLEKFEQEFPIAIRAGAKGKNNVEENLLRALQFLGHDVSRDTDADSSSAKQEKLLAEKESLVRALDTNVPQRIDQGVRSALKAYGTFRQTRAEIESKQAALVRDLGELGFDCDPGAFNERILQPFSEWLGAVETYRGLIEADEQKRARLGVKTERTVATRDGALQSVGLDPAGLGGFDWLVSGPAPEILEAWLAKLRSQLSVPLENDLAPVVWDEAFDRWASSKEAATWRGEALHLANDIRKSVGEMRGALERIRETQGNLRAAEAACDDSGIERVASADPAVLGAYLADFAEWCGLPATKVDWLPFSPRSKVRRRLKRHEKALRKELPISVWRSIGSIDDENRENLSVAVEKLLRWLKALEAWNETANSRSSVEKRFGELRGRSRQLDVEQVPREDEEVAWMIFSKVLTAHAADAEQAISAWKRREAAERARGRLRDLALEYSACGAGVPIVDTWRAGIGREVTQLINDAGTSPNPDTVSALRSATYSGSFSSLLDGWRKARDAQLEIGEIRVEVESVPCEADRIREWHSTRPKAIRLPSEDESALPDTDSRLWTLLNGCRAWSERWREFSEAERPGLERRSAEEYAWAGGELAKAAEAIPDETTRVALQLIQERTSRDPGDGWPVEEIQKAVQKFSPSRIRGRIERIDSQLEELAFSLATENRLRRLQGDPGLQESLDKLLDHYRRNRGRISTGGDELYRECLAALPVWVTVASSPQWIPLLPGLFDLLVIDEATQCTLTNLLPLIYRAKRLAVIGDPKQLPAIPSIGVDAEKALAAKFEVADWLDFLGHAENDVWRTAARCLPRRYSDVVNLVEHYRSHPLIIGFSNQHIYQQKLSLRKEPGASVKVPTGPGVFKAHIQGSCERGPHGRSWINKTEAEEVVRLIRELRSADGFSGLSIGVVTPFRPQSDLIQEMLERSELLRGITVGPAHKYQGDERDIMIFSAVVSRGISPSAARWVESPPNLVNVAVTRAREALFLVADYEVCRRQPGILRQLLDYVETVDRLRATSLDELELFSWMVVQGWNPEVHKIVGDIEVDFVLSHQGARLAVEVDGQQHEQSREADKARDAFLRGQGYDVLRVPARSVRETPADVLHEIAVRLDIGEGNQ